MSFGILSFLCWSICFPFYHQTSIYSFLVIKLLIISEFSQSAIYGNWDLAPLFLSFSEQISCITAKNRVSHNRVTIISELFKMYNRRFALKFMQTCIKQFRSNQIRILVFQCLDQFPQVKNYLLQINQISCIVSQTINPKLE